MSTAKRRKRFPVYETLLRLYPKSFRAEYGEQMVQTLADMLEDSKSKHERTAIWLRVAGEFPLSVMHEVTSSLGGVTMSRLAKISNKQLLIAGAVVISLVLIGVFTVGRKPVMQTIGDRLYGHSVQRMLAKQNTTLGSPFKLPNQKEPAMGFCAQSGVSGLTTRLSCVAATSSETNLDESEAGKRSALQRIESLEAALRTAGYKSGSNGVTITSLVEDVYAGKDSSPDAFYVMSTGPYVCMYGMRVAYVEPLPKAISMSLTCVRIVYLLGGPFGDRPDMAQDLPV